jgi:hypothetical protein
VRRSPSIGKKTRCGNPAGGAHSLENRALQRQARTSWNAEEHQILDFLWSRAYVPYGVDGVVHVQTYET